MGYLSEGWHIAMSLKYIMIELYNLLKDPKAADNGFLRNKVIS